MCGVYFIFIIYFPVCILAYVLQGVVLLVPVLVSMSKIGTSLDHVRCVCRWTEANMSS